LKYRHTELEEENEKEHKEVERTVASETSKYQTQKQN